MTEAARCVVRFPNGIYQGHDDRPALDLQGAEVYRSIDWSAFNEWPERFRARGAVIIPIVLVPAARLSGEWLDAWIEQNFTGHGVAIRREEERPVPGEPLMSMAVAKELTRRAVIEALRRSDACEPILGRAYEDSLHADEPRTGVGHHAEDD